jgi:hypothetical protein
VTGATAVTVVTISAKKNWTWHEGKFDPAVVSKIDERISHYPHRLLMPYKKSLQTLRDTECLKQTKRQQRQPW